MHVWCIFFEETRKQKNLTKRHVKRAEKSWNRTYLVVYSCSVVAIDPLSLLEKGRIAPVGLGLVLRTANRAKHFGDGP